MAKNQGARHRKYDNRNGSGSRGKGGAGDGAAKVMRNGRGSGKNHKQLEDTPAWVKTAAAVIAIGAVLIAAFVTGVIRIDRNVDKEESDDVPCTPVTEPQPTVAEIRDPGNGSRKNGTEYIKEQANVSQDTPAGSGQESLHNDEEDIASDKKEKESEQSEPGVTVKDDERTATGQESAPNSEIPAQPNVTNQETGKHDIPVEVPTTDAKGDDGKGREMTNNNMSDDSKSKLQGDGADREEQETVLGDTVPKEDTVLSRETEGPLEDAPKTSRTKDSEVEEKEFPKGKLVRPKKILKEKMTPGDLTKEEAVVPDHVESLPEAQERTQEKDQSGQKVSKEEDNSNKELPRGKCVRPKKILKEKKVPSDLTEEEAAVPDQVESLPEAQERTQEKDQSAQKILREEENQEVEEVKTVEKSKISQENVDNREFVETKTPEESKPTKRDSSKPTDGESETPSKSKQKESIKSPETKPTLKDKESLSAQSAAPPSSSSVEEPDSKAESVSKASSSDQSKSKAKEPSKIKEPSVPPSSKTEDNPRPQDPSSPPPPSSKSEGVPKATEKPPPQESPAGGKTKESPKTNTKTKTKATDSPPQDHIPSDKTKEAPKAQTTSKEVPKAQTKLKKEKKKVSPPPSSSSSQTRDVPKRDEVPKAKDGKDSGAAAKDTAIPSSRAHVDDPDRELEPYLQEAEKLLKKKKTEEALRSYEEIMQSYPDSPKARLGKARTLDQMAEERRSNNLLQDAIKWYRIAADAPDSPIEMRKEALSRMADRLSFLGRSSKSIQVYQELVRDFPQEMEYQKDLAVQYLILGQNGNAKPYFRKMIEISPHDGFALVHLGFILKTEENYQEAIPLLKEGISTGERGTNEGKFFFHLGDSYLRLGQQDEAYKVYDDGVSRGHFRSRYQRSLYNVNTLRAKPFWTPKEAGYAQSAKKLESNWEAIRDEALSLLSESGYFRNEEEKLRETGDWKQFTLYARGNKDNTNCQRAPVTCRLIDTIPESSGCKRGQVKFSVMHPGTHVWPHCGPTNCRLRAHLGLVVPQPVRLRVANATRTWEEGKVFIFDDSFEHEVWQEADRLRLVLIIDLWHPDLSEHEKRRLSPI